LPITLSGKGGEHPSANSSGDGKNYYKASTPGGSTFGVTGYIVNSSAFGSDLHDMQAHNLYATSGEKSGVH